MHFLIVSLFSLLLAPAPHALSQAIESNRPIYLNISNDATISIYNDRGVKISDCEASYCVDNLREGAKIRYLDQGNKYIYSQFRQAREDTLMYQIEYQYTKSNGSVVTGTGWVESDYITSQKRVTLAESVKSGDCHSFQASRVKAYKEIIKRFSDEELALQNIKSINRDYSKLIEAGVGTCIATQQNIKTKLHNQWIKNEFIYDSVVLPVMNQKKPPDIVDENGRKITNQDLREIDVLARTI